MATIQVINGDTISTGKDKVNANFANINNEVLTNLASEITNYSKTNERISDIIAQSGTSDTEVVDARGGFTVLNDRLDDVDSSLANNVTQLGLKAPQTALDATNNVVALKANQVDARLRAVKLGQADMTDELLQQIAGTTSINAVPTNVSIDQLKLVDKSIPIDKTNFMQIISNNRFNKNSVLSGYTVGSTGEPSINASFELSKFIPVLPNTEYTFFAVGRYGFYSNNYTFILTDVTGTTGTKTITTSADCYYIKVAVATGSLSSARVNIGNALQTYDDYKIKINNVKMNTDDVADGSITTSKIATNGITNTKLSKSNVTFDKTNFMQVVSNNLFNKDSILLNSSINATTGLPSVSSGNNLSDYIPVVPNTEYTFRLLSRIAYYDDLYKLISTNTPIPTDTITVVSPINCSYIRMVFSDANVTGGQINKDGALKDLDLYKIQIDNLKIESTFGIANQYVLDSDATGIYSPSMPMESVDDSTVSPLVNKKIVDIYAEYDALVSAYPEYITKTLLCTESTGLPVYRYDFTPVQASSISTKFPKMLLVSGEHPEKTGVWCTLQTLKEICSDWKNNPLLDLLRWNVNFIVVPISNPWGFNAGIRTNANGVDLNRNYPTGWVQGTFGEDTYGGTTPLSEIETQSINQIMIDNPDILYYVSFHNYFTPVDAKDSIWVASGTLYNQTCGKALITKMSRKWKKDYTFCPQDDTTLFGYVGYTPNGTSAKHATSYGYESSTFEVAEKNTYETIVARGSSVSITQGVEAFCNWLILILKNLTKRD